jgi:hypothetical protein
MRNGRKKKTLHLLTEEEIKRLYHKEPRPQNLPAEEASGRAMRDYRGPSAMSGASLKKSNESARLAPYNHPVQAVPDKSCYIGGTRHADIDAGKQWLQSLDR